MKKLLMLLMLAPAPALAGPDAMEIPISSYSAVQVVSIASHAWTNATPAAARLTDQWAVIVDNPSSNSAAMHGHIWSCTAPTVSTSTYKGPIELTAADPAMTLQLTEDLCLWLVSRHTSAENVMVQGVRKRR